MIVIKGSGLLLNSGYFPQTPIYCEKSNLLISSSWRKTIDNFETNITAVNLLYYCWGYAVHQLTVYGIFSNKRLSWLTPLFIQHSGFSSKPLLFSTPFYYVLESSKSCYFFGLIQIVYLYIIRITLKYIIKGSAE